ncbi:MAG: coenzyme F420-0:L-glutamate ligase [Chloroflexota bacterium]|nr:coenzyme F420-0:L-glutamate ligase [Chloroflexota bacterium]
MTHSPAPIPQHPSELRIFGLGGVPEVTPGDDVAALVGAAVEASGLGLEPGDVLVVTHKIVSKAEGRLVRLPEVEPSALASRLAADTGKDARQIEVVLREAKRISRMDRGVIIAETVHGFVCANAGVDASNVASEVVCLLPEDPDASAAGLRAALRERFGVDVGVIVSDSFGRPWRNGIVNVAIGVAGLAPLADYRGQHDPAGYELRASVLAVADELAAAAELVMHKLEARPVALIRGYVPPTDAPPGTGRDLVMDPARDLYR